MKTPAKKLSILRSAKVQALLGTATTLTTIIIVATGTSRPKWPTALGE
jgi:hypothetical protein